MKTKIHFRKASFAQPHTHNKLTILSFTQGKQVSKDYKELTPDLLHYYFLIKKSLIPQWRMIAREARY